MFTNKFQLITAIEKYIASHHCTSQRVLVEIRVRQYGVGDKNRVTSNVIMVTFSKDDVYVVTTTLREVSKKKLLPGLASFCPLDIHKIGVEPYKRILNGHNKYVNNMKKLAMINIKTIDFENVLKATSSGITVRDKYIKQGSIII